MKRETYQNGHNRNDTPRSKKSQFSLQKQEIESNANSKRERGGTIRD